MMTTRFLVKISSSWAALATNVWIPQNLRGTIVSNVEVPSSADDYHDGYHNHRTLTTTSTTATTANDSGNKSFAIMLTVLVGLILAFFVVCTYQILRIWLCKHFLHRSDTVETGEHAEDGTIRQQSTNSSDTVLVHAGRVFNLSGYQRRAVLEAIFSDTCKAVTDQDVANEKKTRKPTKRKSNELSVAKQNDDDNNSGNDNGPANDVIIPNGNESNRNEVFEMTLVNRNHDTSIPVDTSASHAVSYCCLSPITSSILSPFGRISEETMALPSNETSTSMDSLKEQEELNRTVDTSASSINDYDTDPIHNFTCGSVNSDAPSGMLDEDASIVRLKKIESIQNDDPCKNEESDSYYGSGKQRNIARSKYVEDDDTTTTAVRGNLTITGLRPPAISAASTTFVNSADRKDSIVEPNVKLQRQNLSFTSDPDEDNNVFPSIVMSTSTESMASDSYVSVSYLPSLAISSPVIMEIPLVPLAKQESLMSTVTPTSEYSTTGGTYLADDDSSNGENICSICLSGYTQGDVLVVSKHCTHCFHKDCILQWLENHNDCPFCRVDMITDSEMNKAATHLVGKTRMYRAVATMQPSSSLTSSAIRTTTTSTPNGSSPVVLAHSYRPYSLQQRPSRRNIHSTQQQIRTVPAPTTIGGRGTVRRNALAQSALDGTSR